jgi:signal transduction histidine kinase
MSDVVGMIFERVWAHRDLNIERMVAAGVAAGPWPKGPLDIGPAVSAPDPASAEAYLEAMEAWLVAENEGPITAWFQPPWPPGLLAFHTVARDLILDAASGAEGQVRGQPVAEFVRDQLDRLTARMSARLDAVLAREERGIRALAQQLEGIHTLASPLNVITLQAELAQMRLESGATDGVRESLAELMKAGERLIDERRKLSDRTEGWCHELRRTMKDLGELTDQ